MLALVEKIRRIPGTLSRNKWLLSQLNYLTVYTYRLILLIRITQPYFHVAKSFGNCVLLSR